MRTLAVLAAVSVSWLPLAAVAQEAAPVSEMVAEIDLPYEEFTLDNGLRVVVHTDRKTPVVAVQAWYNVGSKDEPAGQTGFAHLFEHIGLFNPTENLPGGLMIPLRNIGATDWNGTTWHDRTNFFQTVPTAALEQALYMESDRMGHLIGALNQERLDNQRGVVQNEKRQGDNQPYGMVEYAQLEALFPEGHPYRHSTIGSMADLDAASLQDLRDWHRDNYGPNNAVLSLAGDIDADEARVLVQKYFGHIPRGPQNEPAQAAVPTLDAPVSIRMHDRVANTRLYRNWVVPGRADDSAVPLQVASQVLGGLASSRLDAQLVRGDQTASAVYSYVLPFQRVSLFEVGVDVKPGEDVDAVAARLDAIIADLIANGPTAAEVQRAATTTVSGSLFAIEKVGGFSGQSVVLAEGELYSDDPGFFKKSLEDYASVTPQEVRAAMQQWLGRPVLSIRVDPGEREPYEEAAADLPPPAAVEPLAITPRGPMPDVGDIAGLDFPDTQRATLSNGVKVVYAQRDALPVTVAAIEFNAGLAADPADKLGLQTLMLNVLEDGTTTRDAAAIAEAQETLGASISANASMDRTALTLSTPSANLEGALELLSDIARNPAFAPAEIERLREQQLASIAQEATTPNSIAFRAMPELVYGSDHPYGRPASGLGTEAVVQGLTRDDLVGFHKAWMRPDNATIFVVSDRPLAEITGLLEDRFGDWAAPGVAKGHKTFPANVPAPASRIILIDRPQSPQSVIYAGEVLADSGTDDTVSLYAGNEVIGAGFLSRINQDIRETRGWSYGVQGGINAPEGRMFYFVAAPVQADRTGDSIKALLDNYSAFEGDRGTTPEEHTRTMNGRLRSLAGGYETSANVLASLRSNALYDRPDTYWDTIGDRYRTMTAADMDSAIRDAVDTGRWVWVVVGDAAVVKPQLESLGLPIEVRTAGE